MTGERYHNTFKYTFSVIVYGSTIHEVADTF